MDELSENVFDKIIEENFSEEKLILLLFEKKLNAFDIKLTKKQKKQLIFHWRTNTLEEMQIEPTIQQSAHLQKLGHNELVLDFGQADFDEFQEEINQLFFDESNKTIERLSEKLKINWNSQLKSVLKKLKANQQSFTNHLSKIWGKPLDLLEALISISTEYGLGFNYKYRPIEASNNNVVFDALTRLHARGCQVSSEVLALLKNGFADGAHARWRTLHEICVVAMFIGLHDNDVAEKYLDHYAVTDYHDALQYNKYYEVLSYPPISESEYASIKSAHEESVKRYGPDFDSDYGWAAEVLGKRKPSFVDIEEKVQLSHMRPFYKLANMNVHSGSKGARLRLGLPPKNPNLLVAGSSIYGLAEPGQNTAYSIFSLTTTLLRLQPNLENASFTLAYQKLMEEVMLEFDKVAAKSENF